MKEDNTKRDELLLKYRKVELTFDHYYKFTFHYKGVADDGTAIEAAYGGSSDDIYRYNVENNRKVTLDHSMYESAAGLEHTGERFKVHWRGIKMTDKDGNILLEWYFSY